MGREKKVIDGMCYDKQAKKYKSCIRPVKELLKGRIVKIKIMHYCGRMIPPRPGQKTAETVTILRDESKATIYEEFEANWLAETIEETFKDTEKTTVLELDAEKTERIVNALTEFFSRQFAECGCITDCGNWFIDFTDENGKTVEYGDDEQLILEGCKEVNDMIKQELGMPKLWLI